MSKFRKNENKRIRYIRNFIEIVSIVIINEELKYFVCFKINILGNFFG